MLVLGPQGVSEAPSPFAEICVSRPVIAEFGAAIFHSQVVVT